MNEHKNDHEHMNCDQTLPAGGLEETLRQSDGKQPVFDAPEEWKPGDVVAGLYEVRGVLGEGAFGKVYLVYHQNWQTELAVKSPRQDTLSDRGAVARFLREAETWVKLGMHPNIVTCYYVRELGKIPRIFLEYVSGGSLRKRLENPVDLRDVLDFAIQICRGMSYAHDRGLVHRDLKPENCLLTENGELKVTDFGLVKIDVVEGVGDQKSVGRTGRAGTPEYMAPEQWINAAEATFKTEIFAFGAVI
jgi:serine/threonine protein kinase